MLHFFRKIRRDLIANSETYKYLKYAIGEVILVVLGILIAIQINNWNEKREGDIIKEVYIQRLKHDLERDTINLNRYIYSADKDIRLWRKIEKQIQKPDATLDSIIKIYKYAGMNISDAGLSPLYKATYNSLLATGDIELFKEDHLVMLMDFYALREGSTSRLIRIQEYTWSIDHGEFNFLLIKDKTSIFYKKQREKIDEAKFLGTFYHLVKLSSGTIYYNREAAHYGLVRTREVLKILNNPSENSYSDISYIFK